MDSYYNIGKILRVKGLQGTVLVSFNPDSAKIIKDLRHLFIQIRTNSYIPFFIESKKRTKGFEYEICFEKINTKEQAQEIVNKPIFIAAEVFIKNQNVSVTAELIGYKIMYQGKLLSNISDIVQQRHQNLMVFFINQKEVLIPIQDNTIQRINHALQQIDIEIPDGLLEIYLSD